MHRFETFHAYHLPDTHTLSLLKYMTQTEHTVHRDKAGQLMIFYKPADGGHIPRMLEEYLFWYRPLFLSGMQH